jgi:hypothetical protein
VPKDKNGVLCPHFWRTGLAEGGGYAAAVDTVINDCKTDLFNPFLAAQVIVYHNKWVMCTLIGSQSSLLCRFKESSFGQTGVCNTERQFL